MADSPNPIDVKKALTFKGATVAWAILKTQDHRVEAGALTYRRLDRGPCWQRSLQGRLFGSNTKLPLGRVFESKIHGVHCRII